jgi:hypothetical protein
MQRPVIIIGIGEIGSVIARGFLRLGYPVYPVTRASSMHMMAEEIPNPAMVIVAVGENDLHPVLESIPPAWRDLLVLIQNELLPRDWLLHGIKHPTIVSVWFEKKKGQDSKIVVPSVAYGPNAELIASALGTLNIPVEVLLTEDRLLFELVRKNLYILTSNIAGLETGGDVHSLWRNHHQLAQAVAQEVLQIQGWLTGQALDKDALIQAMLVAFEGDPKHGCTGRSAPARLSRALEHAAQAGLKLPTLEAIAAKHLQ